MPQVQERKAETITATGRGDFFFPSFSSPFLSFPSIFSFFRTECLPTSPLISLLPSLLFLGFKVSLRNEGWPHICHPPASIFPELGLQMTAITSILVSATKSIKTHPHESLGGTKYPTMTHIHAEFPRVKSGRFYTF